MKKFIDFLKIVHLNGLLTILILYNTNLNFIIKSCVT